MPRSTSPPLEPISFLRSGSTRLAKRTPAPCDTQYQEASKAHAQWEKGHYYLGRHYKKVMESEKMLSRISKRTNI